MKRISLFVVIILILVQLLTFSVFAADADASGSGWNVIDSIGNFFSDLIKTIVNLGKSIYEFILKGVDYLLTGLKKLFIPRNDYFDKMTDRVYAAFEKKFGGFLSLAKYLKESFTNIRAFNGNLFVVKFPKNHFFGGVNLDILSGSGGFADMVRGALSGFVMLCTVSFCYRKVISMINT